MSEKNLLEKNLYIRVIEYGLKKLDGFTVDDLFADKKAFLTEHEKTILTAYFEFSYANGQQVRTFGNSGNSESLFILAKKGSGWRDGNSLYSISFDATFRYLEFQELQFARENAKEARNLSQRAIRLSILAIITSALVPIVVSFFLTQSVQIVE